MAALAGLVAAASSGRLYPVAKRSMNDRYVRDPVGWNRRRRDIHRRPTIASERRNFDVARAGGSATIPTRRISRFRSKAATESSTRRVGRMRPDRLMRTAAGETDLRRAEMLAEVERLLLEEEPVVLFLFYEFEESGVEAGARLARQPARPASGAVFVSRAGRRGVAWRGKRTFRNLATAAKQRVRCRNSA